MSEEKQFHDYRIRIPETLFKAIDHIAWKSKKSINKKIAEILFDAIMSSSEIKKEDKKAIIEIFNAWIE